MKKLFFAVCLMIGAAFTAKADTMCSQTMNVEPTMKVSSGNLIVKCQNYNDYKVTVVITASINGGCERSATIVIPKGETKEANLGKCGTTNADESQCGVSLSVWKCD